MGQKQGKQQNETMEEIYALDANVGNDGRSNEERLEPEPKRDWYKCQQMLHRKYWNDMNK